MDEVIDVARARRLQGWGLLRLFEYLRYYCTCRDEEEFPLYANADCDGFAVLRKGAVGPLDCNVCTRSFYVELKKPYPFYATELVLPAVCEGILEAMKEADLVPEERARGQFLARTAVGTLHVVLADHCKDDGLFKGNHPDESRILFLWAERAGLDRLPRGARRMPLTKVFEEPEAFLACMRALASAEPWPPVGDDPVDLPADSWPPGSTRASDWPATANVASEEVEATTPEVRVVATLYSHSGKRNLTTADVADLHRKAGTYDLFLSELDRAGRPAVFASSRSPEGEPRTAKLSGTELALLAATVRNEGSIALSTLSAGITAYDKIFTTARRKVDFVVDGEWRAFRKWGTGERAIVEFVRPPGMTYAILLAVT